jgi:DNA-binding transcriptional ArsR family regulator
MIRLLVDDESLNAIRLAMSPLWETIGSLALLVRYRGEAPSPYTSWVRCVRQGMPADIQRGVQSLIPAPGRPFPPSFFVQVPDPARSTLDTELAQVRERAPDDQPTRDLLEFMELYWDWAIAPYWSMIRSSLEEEALFRGRTLAVEGPEAMLAELEGRLTWSRPELSAPYHRDLTHPVMQSKLLLVPSVFSGGTRIFTAADPGVVALSYQVHTTGFLHVPTTKRPPDPQDRLAVLLGVGRAQVLRTLAVPKTTTAVAESLGLAKSTVSQHLAVLTAAGVVWRHRLGGQVFYQLDQAGFILLEHLDA